jgi:hypothetical protein
MKQQLPKNRQATPSHKHGETPRYVYAGYSLTAPGYHLWRCVAQTAKPRKVADLIAFDLSAFDPESKAGQGGCSMRLCPRDATHMNRKQTLAYCDHCTERVTRQQGACLVTIISMCCDRLLNQGLPEHMRQPCLTCITLEGGDIWDGKKT